MAKYTYENNFDLAQQAIKAAPQKVLPIIGKMLRDDTKNKLTKRTGRLKRSVGYWARKKEGDLQVGFYDNFLPGKRWAAFYKEAVIADNNPLREVVEQRRAQIVQLIAEALAEVGTKSKTYNQQVVDSIKDEQG